MSDPTSLTRIEATPPAVEGQSLNLPGASMRNSARGKGHEEGGSAYAKAGSSLRRPPVPEHLPQNQSLPTLLFNALTYTSDLTGGCPPPPLSEKELTYRSS